MKFVLSIAVGLVVGMVIAPRKGEETRELLAQKSREKLEQAARSSEQKAGDIGSEIGRRAGQNAVRKVADKVLGEDSTRKSA